MTPGFGTSRLESQGSAFTPRLIPANSNCRCAFCFMIVSLQQEGHLSEVDYALWLGHLRVDHGLREEVST